MVCCGLRVGFLHSECPSTAVHLYFFTLGLILAHYTTLSSRAPVNCKDISSAEQNCGFHPDGVRDLDCFRKRELAGRKTWRCAWKPGNRTSNGTYTLIIQQDAKYCKVHDKLTGSSEKVVIFQSINLTAQVFQDTESKNCTKAVFRGSPERLFRCGPPHNATFLRHSGKVDVNVSWQHAEKKVIKYYTVRYKALGSLLWKELSVRYQKEKRCTLENVNSSLVYIVQIKCVTDAACSQCPWSETYTVPPELTARPVLADLEDADIAKRTGRRLLSLAWKLAAKEMFDGFYVTVGKASGEPPCEQMNTTQPEIRLILSYSAYQVNIRAFNSASTSPALSWTIKEREDVRSSEAGQLNVTAHSNASFTVRWKDHLVKQYVCYSVEWTERGRKAAYMSFFENIKNYKTFSGLPESLEPYKRYSLTLHVRPNKDPCNLQHVNNSESTYGRTQFYFTEGSPVSAPSNITSHNVMLNSVALRWSPIPEEDVRGFLLGYVIHYAEYHDRRAHTEKNITVAPELNSYVLGDLKTGTAYQVQISGFTRAGSGVRSITSLFKTHHQGYVGVSVAIFVAMAAVLTLGSPLLKRAKAVLWPSIPNPENSKAMQKIDKTCELELLELIDTLKVEEWDTHSLQIIEREAAVPVSTLPFISPLLHNPAEDEDVPEMTRDWIQRDSDDVTGDIVLDAPADIQQTDLERSQFAFSCGYTTMEMFKQAMPQGLAANTAVTQGMESEPEDMIDLTVVKPELDYIRQFSTSPVLGNEDKSTML